MSSLMADHYCCRRFFDKNLQAIKRPLYFIGKKPELNRIESRVSGFDFETRNEVRTNAKWPIDVPVKKIIGINIFF